MKFRSLQAFWPALAVVALCYAAYFWDGLQTAAVLRATLTFAIR